MVLMVHEIRSQLPETCNTYKSNAGVQNLPWGPFLFTLMCGTVLAQSGELVAVGKVPASTASLTLSLVVVWGLICGALFNHDRLAPLSCVGAAAILMATIVPKVLDVLADRSATTAAAEEKQQPAELPPVAITSEEFVRTTVSASMLAATPVLSEAGIINTTTSTAASALTRQVVTTAAETSLSVAGFGTAAATSATGADVAAAGAAVAADVLANSVAESAAGSVARAAAGEAAGTAAASTSGEFLVHAPHYFVTEFEDV
jgi:hypothetical protein